MKIRVYDEAGGGKRVRWRLVCEATRARMLRDNRDAPEVVAWLRRARPGQSYTGGGGAAPAFRLTAAKGKVRRAC